MRRAASSARAAGFVVVVVAHVALSSSIAAASASTVLLGQVAVSAEEHLVEARWPSEEVGDPDPRATELGDSLRAPVRVTHGTRARLGRLEVDLRARSAGCSRPRACSRSSRRNAGAGSDRGLELAGRALSDHLAVVDDRDPVRELVGLVEVLGAEQDHRPSAPARMMSQTWFRERGSSPVVGSSRNITCRGTNARRCRAPASHAAGVVLDQAPGGVGDAERLQSSPARAFARAAATRASGPSRIRFSRPVRSSSTEAS